MKKTISFALSLSCILASAFCGAGCKKDDGNTLRISVVNVGYGAKWAHELADAFMEKNEGITVEVDDTYYGGRDKEMITELCSGVTETDIYFSRSAMFEYMQKGQSAGGTYYECLLEDLTDWYAAENKYDGGKTVKEKIDQNILKDITVEKNSVEKQYSVPWVTDCLSILYNTQIFSEHNYSVPNTTDQLLALCEKMKSDGVTPFVDSASDPYFGILQEGWITQYEGIETMDRLWEGYAPNGDRYTTEIFTYPGIYETYKVLYELMCYDNGYLHSESDDLSFTAAQNYVLDKKYNVAMMPDGDWIQREMDANYTADEIHLGFMKMPVLSAVVKKLEYRNSDNSYMSDEMLAKVITAIDAGETVYENVSANDMAKIMEARSIITGWSFGHIGYIPVYSTKKDLAKDFLHFMVSDEGLRIFTKATVGSTQPYAFDYLADETTSSVMNDFAKSVYSVYKSSHYRSYEIAKNPLFSLGGVTINYQWSGVSLTQAFRARKNESNYKTASEFFAYRKNTYDNQWDKVLTAAGVSPVYVG